MVDYRLRKDKEDKKKPKQEEANENVFIDEILELNQYEKEVALTEQQLNETDWYMDSGASKHMCSNSNLFEYYKEISDEQKVKIGNGTFLKICGVGTISLNAWNGHERIKTKISNVLFVPKLKINLFSLGCALEKDYKMHSDVLKCALVNKNDAVCAIAKKQGKLYEMIFKSSRNNRCTHYCQGNAVCQVIVETLTN